MARTAMTLACAVLTFATGCFVAPYAAMADNDSQIVPGPPPAFVYEAVPPRPGAEHVWMAGHWQRAYGRWVWIRGAWEVIPYPGAVWVPGRWVPGAYGWVWVPGHWQGTAGYPGYAPASPETVVVASPPPPPRTEVVVAAPFPGAIWIGGFWRWTSGGWVWAAGRWAPAPWRGAAWVPGHWRRGGGGWIWIGGFWR